jgi:hypothetical protein
MSVSGRDARFAHCSALAALSPGDGSRALVTASPRSTHRGLELLRHERLSQAKRGGRPAAPRVHQRSIQDH